MVINNSRGARSAGDQSFLSISEVARRTGISVAGLRNWEARYGLPRPERSPSGQRRYRETDCVLLADVVRRHAAGLSIGAAMALAVQRGEEREVSFFAALRQRHPQLIPHVLDRRVMTGLTRAIEDEICASALRPILFGSFQRQRFFDHARARWTDLAHTAEKTVVFADFARVRHQPGPIVEIPVPESSPLRREWVLVCDSPDHAACLIGWEHLGQDSRASSDRKFEAVWSVDPEVVRDASRIGVALAVLSVPQLATELDPRLSDGVTPGSADLRRAAGLLDRTLDYLSR